MSTALAIAQPNQMAAPDTAALTEADWEERKQRMRETILRGATPAEVDHYILVCKVLGFDPILRQIDFIDRQVYINHKGLLHLAHRSGLCNGIYPVEVWETETHYCAKVAVHRKDMQHPFIYPGRYLKTGRNKQYGQEMAITRAECMALRRAFDVSLPVKEEINWPENQRVEVEDTEEAPRLGAELRYIEARSTGKDPATSDAPLWNEIAEAQRAEAPAPAPPKVEDWPDPAIFTKLGSKLKDQQYQRLATIYIGRATDRESLLARTKDVLQAGPPADGFRAMVTATATARGDALGLPRKGAAPPPPADDLTEVVGEPEGNPQARRIANIRALAQQSGWDEARLTSMARNLYGTEDLARWSADQLVSLEQFIRAGNHAAAAG